MIFKGKKVKQPLSISPQPGRGPLMEEMGG